MKLSIKKNRDGKHKEFDFPAPMYFIAKFFNEYRTLANLIHTIESFKLRNQIKKINIIHPIYITGLARSGTTITLSMLNQHPDVATHKYLHMVIPYIPHWMQEIANLTPIMRSPSERLHKDRILVTRDSPEAVEEIFWQKYFENLHDENYTNIIDKQTQNAKFEAFYKDHIKKLLINQNAIYYVAKNNYNIARLGYLLKLFPNSKFVILIRNPFDHIASLVKQDRILKDLEYADPRLLDWTKIIGHREFGSAKVCINLNNFTTIQTIRRLWNQRDTYVKGWAIYWREVYSYIHMKLQSNPKLAKASLLIRYEDLCEFPDLMIDKIVDHVEINPKKFRKIKKYYCNKLRAPSYYKMKYSDEEHDIIIDITGDIAKEYGYPF